MLLISLTHFSFSLPLSLSALSAVLDGKTMMVKVRGENRRRKVEAAVCKTTADEKKLQHKYREKLWGRWLVNGSRFPPCGPISEDWALTHRNTSTILPQFNAYSLQCLLLTTHLVSKNRGWTLKSYFRIWKNISKELRMDLRSSLFPFIFPDQSKL